MAWVFFLGGIVVDACAWAGLVGQSEPPLVVHLSTWAIIYSGYTAMLVAEKR